MKTTSLAVLLSVLVLCNMASAQDYSIRVTYNTNLRDASSLDGNIVETVPSGMILQVIGRFNRWLKIDRNGNELWLADWVPYTRVTDSDQTQSQIDNCCFVDRQCHSDADWTSGYWAFQNNQCPVPEQTRQQTPVQSTTTDTSQVDNCCFLNWQCNSDEEWASGYQAFQIDQCDLPPGFIIEGPADFVAKWKEALHYLESRSPEWFAYAIGGVAKVQQVEGSNIQSIRGSTRIFSMSRDMFFDPVWGYKIPDDLASRLVHEACHVYRYQAGLQPGGYEGEKACLIVNIEAAAIFDPGGLSLFQRILARIDDPEYQWWLYIS